MRVLHVITRMIVGGAQENTLYNCLDLIELFGDDVLGDGTFRTVPRENCWGRAGGPRAPRACARAAKKHFCRRATGPPTGCCLIRRFQPDVVHTHKPPRAACWAGWPRGRWRVPAIVHTVHGAPFYPYQNLLTRRFYQGCEWYAARRCHALISVADAMTELMVTAGVAPREVHHHLQRDGSRAVFEVGRASVSTLNWLRRERCGDRQDRRPLN